MRVSYGHRTAVPGGVDKIGAKQVLHGATFTRRLFPFVTTTTIKQNTVIGILFPILNIYK